MDEARDPEMQALNALLALMHEHDLDRLKVKLGEATYEIVRREAGNGAASFAPVAATAPAPAMEASSESTPVAGPHVKRVIAPLTGVFYRSSSPDAEDFVNPGDRVEEGDVVCILEAMKLFNEIQSDYAGTIARIIPENGELVSQGAELFWIEP
ncbi:MAG: biotin/lipoyl-containing protein [Candidatus Tumulicola sp.]